MARVTDKNVAVRADNDIKNEEPRIFRPEDDQDLVDRFKNREIKGRAMALASRAVDARRRYDWEWLTRDLFRRGYQFSSYNPATRHVVLANTSQVKIPINLVWSQ